MSRHNMPPSPSEQVPAIQFSQKSEPGELEPPIDRALYRTRIREARAGGNYFVVFRPYFRIMSKLDALFLQELMNLASMVTDQSDGWFPCTNNTLERAGWSEKEIEIRIRSLKGCGPKWSPGSPPNGDVWIKTERRGIPPIRWVWIDLDALDAALDLARNATVAPIDPLSGISNSPAIPNDPLCGGIENPLCGGISCTTKNAKSIPNPEGKPRAEDGTAAIPSTPPKPQSNGRPFQGDTSRSKMSVPLAVKTASIPRSTNALAPIAPSINDKPPKTRTEPSDVDLAARIKKFVLAQRWAVSSQRRNWADAAAIMRRRMASIGVTPDELIRVWEWYAANYTPGGGLPNIRHAQDFDRRWDWITDRMNKEEPVIEVATAKTSLHEETSDVLEQVSRLNWPGEAPQRLPGAISKSLTARFAFEVALPKLTLSKAADEIRKRILKDPTPIPHFIGNWFQTFHEKNAWKDDWEGDLKKAVWRADHPEFAKIVNGWMRKQNSFPMDQQAWAEILAAYKKVQS